MFQTQNSAHDALVDKLFEINSKLRLALAKSKAKNSILEQQPLAKSPKPDTHFIEF